MVQSNARNCFSDQDTEAELERQNTQRIAQNGTDCHGPELPRRGLLPRSMRSWQSFNHCFHDIAAHHLCGKDDRCIV